MQTSAEYDDAGWEVVDLPHDASAEVRVQNYLQSS